MTTQYSTNLGLALPVQGELTGTWGDTVNNGITDYVDIAVAGSLVLNGDGAVTLSNTNGNASGTNITGTTAQYAILRITGTLTTTKVITAPSLSKTYTVINAATGGSVTVRASGQTGVTIPAGDRAFIAFNGTDYVRVGASAGGSNTQVQYNSGGNLAGSANLTFDGTTLTANDIIDSSLTANKPVFTNGSKNLVSTGTLGVDQGGTGLTTTTAYSVVFTGTTATGNFQASAGPGSAGQILTSNGAGALPTFQAAPATGATRGQAVAMALVFGL